MTSLMISMRADATHLLSRLTGFYQMHATRLSPVALLVQVCLDLAFLGSQPVDMSEQARVSMLLPTIRHAGALGQQHG
jgi:hypothetical protein